MLNSKIMNDRVLIVGPSDSFKTTLAFKLALDSAAGCKECLYICNKSKLECKFPSFPSTNYSSKEDIQDLSILGKVSMKYVGNVQDLKLVFAGLQSFTPAPTMIVIEDLSQLIDPFHAVGRNDSNFLNTCLGVLAVIMDAVNYLESSSNTAIKLVITDNCLLDQYLHVIVAGSCALGRQFAILKLNPLISASGVGVNLELRDGGANSIIGSLVHDKHSNNSRLSMIA